MDDFFTIIRSITFFNPLRFSPRHFPTYGMSIIDGE